MIFDFIIEESELLEALKLDKDRMKIIEMSLKADEKGKNFVNLLIEYEKK